MDFARVVARAEECKKYGSMPKCQPWNLGTLGHGNQTGRLAQSREHRKVDEEVWSRESKRVNVQVGQETEDGLVDMKITRSAKLELFNHALGWSSTISP
jgi:hypothetical protein